MSLIILLSLERVTFNSTYSLLPSELSLEYLVAAVENFTLPILKHQEHYRQVQMTIIFYGNCSSYETRHFSLFLSCTKHKCYRLTPYNCILNSILTIMLNIRDILKSYSRRFNVYVEIISKIDTESTCISHAKNKYFIFRKPQL